MRDCGQVGELSKDNGSLRVTWQIAYSSMPSEVNTYQTSPHFSFGNMRWFLRMYPNGDTTTGFKGWIGLYLCRDDEGPPKTMHYAFSIRKADGSDKNLFSSESYEDIYSEKKPGRGCSKCLRKSVLAPSDTLIVICTLWSSELLFAHDERLVSCETQKDDVTDVDLREEERLHLDTKGGTILRKHFQDLLLEGKDHDVTLKVNDQQFKAHKNILRARSPVFAAMFAHNMTENESGDVCIEDCDPNAFGEFLKYVYVGKMENISPSTATGLYYIADKYDFPDLKETCVEFLKASLTTHVISDVITLAMKHSEEELLECAMEFFSKRIMEILMTVEWQRFTTNNPILSNELIIKGMKMSQKQ